MSHLSSTEIELCEHVCACGRCEVCCTCAETGPDATETDADAGLHIRTPLRREDSSESRTERVSGRWANFDGVRSW